MRAGVGAICGLGRALRFLAEADVVVRLGGTLFVVEAVELGAAFVVALGTVFAAPPELAVCAEVGAGASKSNVPEKNSAAGM